MADKVGDKFTEKAMERYRSAKSHQKDWRRESATCYDMVAGHQFTDEEVAELEEMLRPAVTFNRIDPVVAAVTGHQINNRTEVRYSPRQLGDVKINELLTAAAAYVDDNSDAEDEISDAFYDVCVCGLGWTETRVAYDEDPMGKIWGAERTSPLEMTWDPNAKKRNLSDMRYCFHDKWWDRADAENKWPALKDIDLKAMPESWVDAPDFIDEEPHDASTAWMYENDSSRYYREHKDEVRITRYMYYELEPVYIVGDPVNGKPVELDQKKFSRLKKNIEERGIQYVKQDRRRYKQAFFAGELLLEKGDSPCKYSMPFKAITGKRDERRNLWYGLVRAMVDPQKWSNKFFMEIQDILASNRTGGAFFESSALADPRKAEEQWNEVNPLIEVNDGMIDRIKERNPIAFPAGLDRMMEFAVQSIPHVTGLSMEMLGLVDRNQPNVLEVTRKRAGMTILATIFNSLRRYNKERGRLLAWFIHEYISDGRLIKITEGDGTEKYVQLFREQADDVMNYDVIVDESPSSPNQKQETFAVLMEVIPLALKAGVPVPPELIDYMPIPSQLADKWKEMIASMKSNPEADKFKKAMQDLEIKLKAADVKETESKATANEMKALLDQMKAKLTALEARVKPYEVASEMASKNVPTGAIQNQRGNNQ